MLLDEHGSSLAHDVGSLGPLDISWSTKAAPTIVVALWTTLPSPKAFASLVRRFLCQTKICEFEWSSFCLSWPLLWTFLQPLLPYCNFRFRCLDNVNLAFGLNRQWRTANNSTKAEKIGAWISLLSTYWEWTTSWKGLSGERLGLS